MSTQESVWQQIRRLLDEDHAPDVVTEQVMADLPRRWKEFARPFVLRAVRSVEGQIVNRRMRRALGAGQQQDPTTRQQKRRQEAVERLHRTVYRLADGTRVLWDDMTVDMIDLKIAHLRKQVGSLVDHLRILEAARKVCADHGVTRLGDVPDWAEKVSVRCASALVQLGAGSTARKSETWGDVPDGPEGIESDERAA